MDSPSQQKPQSNSSKWIWVIVIVIAILLIGGGLWYWSASKKSTQTTAVPSPSQSPSQATEMTEIKNDSDLQKAQSDLDNTNPDSLDTALSQNDTDAAQF